MVASPPVVEIREWGRPARRRTLIQPLTIGRDCPGEVLVDDGVSREHLRLVPSPTALSAVDLGSRNGTTVNGTALTGRAELSPGDVLRLGRSNPLPNRIGAGMSPSSNPYLNTLRMRWTKSSTRQSVSWPLEISIGSPTC